MVSLLEYQPRPVLEGGIYFVRHVWRCGYNSRVASDRGNTVCVQWRPIKSLRSIVVKQAIQWMRWHYGKARAWDCVKQLAMKLNSTTPLQALLLCTAS